MASPSLTYTLTNGSTADASQVMQDLNDLLNGITDGTKDLSISALTCAGTATLNGHVNLGNSSADDLTITASLASNLVPKTDATYDLGSSSIGLRKAYFGGNSHRVAIAASGSMSADWTLTLPTTAGTANYLLTTNGSGVSAWTAITDSNFAASSTQAGTVPYYREYEDTATNALIVNSGSGSLSSVDVDIRVVRVGKNITMSYTCTFTTSGGSTINSVVSLGSGASGVPSWAYPPHAIEWCTTTNFGTSSVVFASVGTGGNVILANRTLAGAANFAASTTYTLTACGSWSLDI